MATSLGTAWIQIKPSLSGVSNDIKKELAGATVYGTSQMSSQFKSVFSGLGKNIQTEFTNAFNRVASVSKSIFTAGIGAAIGAMTSQIGSAVSRVDILNNFPNIMANLKISAEDSEKAIAKMSEKLQGLPTTLDAGAAAVQRFTTKNNDVAKSTDMFLALNNAILAGGASTEIQSSALEQLSQAYAKGRPDMMEWRTLMMAMPAQINQIALAMGFGANGADALGESLRSGSTSMDDFMDTIMRLNEEGIDGFANFETQAKSATGGIATAFKVAKAAITRSVGDVIKSIPNLSGSIVEAGRAVEQAMKGNMGLSEAASKVQSTLTNILSAIGQALTKIVPLILQILPGIINSIVQGITDLLANEEQTQLLISGFVQLFVAVAKGASQIAMTLIPLIPEIIGTLVGEITKPENAGYLVAGFGILLGVGTFKTIASNLGGVLKSTIGSKFTSFFKTDIAEGVGEKAGSAVKSIGSSLSEAIKGIAAPIKTAFTELGSILSSAVNAIMEPVKAALVGIAEAIKAFLLVFADPQIAIGAALFAVAAAAIAAAIWLLGSAIGAIMPMLEALFNNILIPLMQFVVDTVMTVIKTLADVVTTLIQGALIPLAEFIRDTFLAIIKTMGEVITGLINGAVKPLIEVLAGAFTSVLNAVANILNGVISAALNGIRGIVDAVGDGFIKMGQAVQIALSGVQGVLSVFAQMLSAISSALVAIVALATHQSVNYGAGFAYVTAAATGGLVGGIGTETSDSNLFALSKGEYVIRASAARKIGYDNLDQMNETGGITSGNINNNITINGYNKDPNELAELVSRKIALRTRGVY